MSVHVKVKMTGHATSTVYVSILNNRRGWNKRKLFLKLIIIGYQINVGGFLGDLIGILVLVFFLNSDINI